DRFDNFVQGLPVQSTGKSSWEVICIADDEDEHPPTPGQGISGSSTQFQLMRSGSTHLVPQCLVPWHAFLRLGVTQHADSPTASQAYVDPALRPAVMKSSDLHEVLSQLAASQHGDAIRKRLLAKVSDTTAARYLRSVQLFFTTFEELGGSLDEVDQGLFLDAFFALSRSLEDGPLSNAQNVLKALRWYRKLISLSILPDLYSPAFSTMASGPSKEKRESVPLPLAFHAFLERQVLSPDTPVEKALFCGSVLTCIGASLRFADAQQVAWTSLCPSAFSLRGICYRTKTTSRGAPFGLIGFGLYSTSEEWGSNWLSRWILLLDGVWTGLRSNFGQDLVPDCLFFHSNESGFAPASYAQTLCRLRQLLLEAAVPASQVGEYTLHSMKSTYLSWMAQLNLPLSARFLQGHHKIPESAQLYSRDDIWPALSTFLRLQESDKDLAEVPSFADSDGEETLPLADKAVPKAPPQTSLACAELTSIFFELAFPHAQQPSLAFVDDGGLSAAGSTSYGATSTSTSTPAPALPDDQAQPATPVEEPPMPPPPGPPEFADTVPTEDYGAATGRQAPAKLLLLRLLQQPRRKTAASTQSAAPSSCSAPGLPAKSTAAAPKSAGATAPTQDPPSQATGPRSDPPIPEAPPSRVGDTINDGEGNPVLQLVQLWACRKVCSRCGNAHCQATFADRSSTYHGTHLCRDCKRAQGREQAAQQVEQVLESAQPSACGAEGSTLSSPTCFAINLYEVHFMSELSQLALEASVPTEVMQLLSDFEVATFARAAQLKLSPRLNNMRVVAGKAKPRENRGIAAISELSDLLLDDAPTREIHDGPASYAFISQMLSLASTSIALCQGAHLGALKMYNKKFLQLCFTKYEPASNLRGPTSLEAQAADKRAWEILSDLVNQRAWKLDDALHEVSEVRSDLASLLAPRPHVSKRLLEGQEQWRYRQTGRGRGSQGTGRGGKGRDGKNTPTERLERGGKGKTSHKGGDKNSQSSQGKWLSTIFMEGKKHTLCMRYQSGQCKDPASCRYVHKCAVARFSPSRGEAEVVDDTSLCVPARPAGSQGHLISPQAADSQVSPVAQAIASYQFDFPTCLSLLEESFSSKAAIALRDPAVTQSDAYFNLGAFGFEDGRRCGVFQRTEQFSEIARFLNAFLRLQFPSASWTSVCVSHNVRTQLHTDAGNEVDSLNHSISLGNFAGGEIWITPALHSSAALVPPPKGSESEMHKVGAETLGEQVDTFESGVSFPCSSLHCTSPWHGDRWVLTAYTCKGSASLPADVRAHLRSLGFPLPGDEPTGVAPQPSPTPVVASLSPGFFLDICCGATAPLSVAMGKAGIHHVCVDALGEEPHDLLCDKTYDSLMRLCFSGVVVMAHAAPPCKEYSRLKLRPGGHISLEQPTNAMSWLEPFVQDLLSEVKPRSTPPFGAQDGGGIYSLPDWSYGPRYAEVDTAYRVRPRREGDTDEGHELLVCEGNWQGAESDPALLQELIEEELTAGFLEEVDSIEEAYKRWGKDRVAVGRVNIVKAPGRSPRLVTVVDNSFSLDVKGAHKTSRVREQDRGLLGLRQQDRLFFYKVCPFGATFSSHWFARLGGFFTRCLHLLIWLPHVLLLYVDDLLLYQNAKVLPLSACLTLAFCSCFHIRLSWKKLQTGPVITWIGWQLNLGTACYTLPDDKRNKLQSQVRECLSHRLVSRKQLDKLLGLLQWILHGFPALRPWLCTLYDDMHRPLGTNISIPPTTWPGIATHLNDKMVFISCPAGTSIRPGSTLLSARHVELRCLADLHKVPVSSKRIWMRVADPSSSRRKLSIASKETLEFFLYLSSREWRPRPLRPAPLAQVESAADAFGKGNDCGVGGWLRLPDGKPSWFSHRYTVSDFTSLGLPMQSNANLDISSYETLAQCFILICFWKLSGSGRLAVTLPALSDNTGAESVCNRLYTSKVPLNLFVRKLSMWSSVTGVQLDCSRISGEKNDDADLLSRWDGQGELPDRFLPGSRVHISLSDFWHIRFAVTLHPPDAFLKWQLPEPHQLGPSNRVSKERR
ncbi:unnamed protein product, partial [Symbiodinium necroappetens]